MKITKTETKKYEIEFFPEEFLSITVGQYIETRKKYGLPTKWLHNCFICEKKLDTEIIPKMISVSDVGNRFCCEECYQKYKDERKEEV